MCIFLEVSFVDLSSVLKNGKAEQDLICSYSLNRPGKTDYYLSRICNHNRVIDDAWTCIGSSIKRVPRALVLLALVAERVLC